MRSIAARALSALSPGLTSVCRAAEDEPASQPTRGPVLSAPFKRLERSEESSEDESCGEEGHGWVELVLLRVGEEEEERDVSSDDGSDCRYPSEGE